jgi:hypothetical protein
MSEPYTKTPEQIASDYSACMDSVILINALKNQPMLSSDDIECVNRNKEHLRIMLTKTYWTTENLTPLQVAIA